MKVLHVVGARPNFVKIAPIMRAFDRVEDIRQLLVHTGQHYDDALSDALFDDLGLPRADVNLGVGSGSHGMQTGKALIAFEPVLERERPDWVVTVGSVNSTLAAALVASKLGVPVAHVEAGLRSGDWSMPEEVNRVLTDRLSEALFTTEPAADENLRREGIEPDRIHLVGNVMIDSLDRYRRRAAELAADSDHGLDGRPFALVTLHRPRNVDSPERLKELIWALEQISLECECEVVWPLHPRTAKNLREFGLEGELGSVRVLNPLPYLEFLSLMDKASLVITDSGGVQEETTVLGVPCVTVRPTTERPITVEMGTNRLCGGPPEELVSACVEAFGEDHEPGRPPMWDGKAAERIVNAILNWDRLARRRRSVPDGERAPAVVLASPDPAPSDGGSSTVAPRSGGG